MLVKFLLLKHTFILKLSVIPTWLYFGDFTTLIIFNINKINIKIHVGTGRSIFTRSIWVTELLLSTIFSRNLVKKQYKLLHDRFVSAYFEKY